MTNTPLRADEFLKNMQIPKRRVRDRRRNKSKSTSNITTLTNNETEQKPENEQKTELKDLPQELPDELPEILPEELPEELPDELPDELPEILPDELPDELPQELPDELPEILPEELPQELLYELPDELPQELPDELPDELPEILQEELPQELPKQQDQENKNQKTSTETDTDLKTKFSGSDLKKNKNDDLLKGNQKPKRRFTTINTVSEEHTKQPVKRKSKMEELLGFTTNNDKILKNKQQRQKELELQREKQIQEEIEFEKETLKGPEIKKHDWLAYVLKNHPDVLEVRERALPLIKQHSFSNLIEKSQTEVKDNVSKTDLLQLVMQHLSTLGLKKSIRCLEEETNLRYEESVFKKSELVPLLELGITDVDNIWNLSTEYIDPQEDEDEEDPEILFNKDFIGLGNEDLENNRRDVNIWDEGPDSENNIIIENELIKAGTLNKLIEKLTPPDRQKGYPDYMKTFLMCYQSFTTPQQVLSKLIERYHMPKRSDQTYTEFKKHRKFIQMRVGNVLKKWIEDHFSDFNDRLISEIYKFIDNTVFRDGHSSLSKNLRNAISRMQKGASLIIERTKVEKSPEPILPKNIWSVDLKLPDIDEEEFVRQETLATHGIYIKIKPIELLNQAWVNEKTRNKSPNVIELSLRFTKLSNWVSSTILSTQTIKERIKVVSKMIKLASHFLKLNNFHSSQAILASLEHPHIKRLKYTWEELPKSDKKQLKKLQNIMPPNFKSKNYTKHISTIFDKPIIPNLVYYLTELTAKEEKEPDLINNLINFAKRREIFKIISNLTKYQHLFYNYISVHQILTLLNNLPERITDEEMKSKSLKLEPKKSTRNKIK
ncbi:ras guanine nucleotide exchange factor i-related [Anaeramoeba flamelloides]|uniref:Ras guanine nucleotide exchange factor i-related n=1 Tax=Anaeramoeba flamelloides TaxID=1746091 RepID=A0ABQ8XEK8_9EUKA|nr:ras guanine nucleotide exchange factor i-related [Anaeramoeba flamelloides]